MIGLPRPAPETTRFVDGCIRGFKGLKQAIKLEIALGKYDDVSTTYPQLATLLIADAGHRTLQTITHIRQVCRHQELLGEVHQQSA